MPPYIINLKSSDALFPLILTKLQCCHGNLTMFKNLLLTYICTPETYFAPIITSVLSDIA